MIDEPREFQEGARPAARYDPRAWVTPDDLNVAPGLLGLPLATPRQRLFAMAADLALLALVDAVGNFCLLLAAGLALCLWLRQHRPEVFGQSRGLGRKTAQRPRPLAWAFVAVFAGAGLMQAWQGSEEEADAPARAERAQAALPTAPAAPAAPAEPVPPSPSASVNASPAQAELESAMEAALSKSESLERQQSLRIERLEAQLERARAPAIYALRDEFNYWVDKMGLSYFWAAVYFSLLPLLWPGQTPGKRLLG